MKKLFTIIMVFSFAVAITGCGRKTPVKLPVADSQEKPQTESTDKDKN